MTAWFAIFWKELAALGALGGAIALLVIAPVWLPQWVRDLLFWIAIGVASATISYNIGVKDERAVCKVAQERQLKQETTNGEQARTDAERSVATDPDGVRDDKWNRDNGER